MIYKLEAQKLSKTESYFKKWGWFQLADLFEIKKGKRLTKDKMIEGRTPFIGSSEQENGATAYIDSEPIHRGNTISVTYNGSVAEAFYQPKDFWASDDVNVLYPKFALNPYIALFFTALIRKEKYRFNYGRKWHLERMLTSKIKLPIDKDHNVAMVLIEKYMKDLHEIDETIKRLSKKIHHIAISVADRRWEWFNLGDLFIFEKGERLTKPDRIEGAIPFITAGENNNGVSEYISFDDFKDKKKIFENKITVDMFFNVFYHDYKYFSDDNIHTLLPVNFELNKYNSLFLVTVLNKLKYKYAYGRQVRLIRLPSEKIKLPVDKNGNPDWRFMEDFIKSLPFSASI